MLTPKYPISPRIFATITISLGLATASLPAQSATVLYNDTISFNGLNNTPTTISINFSYNTDYLNSNYTVFNVPYPGPTPNAFSNVSGVLNDGGINFPINSQAFGTDTSYAIRPDNSFHVTFFGPGTSLHNNISFALNTDFFINTNDPLNLLSLANTPEHPLYIIGIDGSILGIQEHDLYSSGQFYAFTENLTYLGPTPSAVPIPPAFALFAASLLGLGFVRKNGSSID